MRTPLRPPGSQGKTVCPGRAGFRPQGAGVWPEQELLCRLWGEAGVFGSGTGLPQGSGAASSRGHKQSPPLPAEVKDQRRMWVTDPRGTALPFQNPAPEAFTENSEKC